MGSRGESAPLLENNESAVSRATTDSAVEDETPFPWNQLLILAFCRLSEPIAFMSIIAYSFRMVQQIKGEEDASFYSGLLVSAFALAETCTAMFWGVLSDRYGRKPIILFALGGTALSNLLFGFATNYWLALLARVLGGLLNGNVAVMQTMVAEMVTRPEHEPRAYAVQPFVWSMGSIAGSALGGFTAEPATSYPRFFSQDGIFGQFPYLLPNLIAVVIVILAMVQGVFFLEETNPVVIARRKQKSEPANGEVVEQSNTPSIQQTSALEARMRDRRMSNASFIASNVPMPVEPNFDLRRPSFTSMDDFKINRDRGMITRVESIPEQASTTSETSQPVVAFNREVILWITAIVLMSYHQIAFGTVLPIFLNDQPRHPGHLDLTGGLGEPLPAVGTFLAVNSFIAMFIQAFVFPIYVSKLGVYKAVVSTTIMLPLFQACMPFVTLLPNPEIGAYVIMALQSFGTIVLYPSALILLKNATASSAVLGRVNGLAMSACSGARTLAPPLVGIIYSALGSGAAWWSSAAFALLPVVELFFISRPKERNEMILRRASVASYAA